MNTKPIAFMLELETSHFDFKCFGNTKKECYEHFWECWKRHCKGCGLDLKESMFPTRKFLETDGADEGFRLVAINSLPVFLRDGEEVGSKGRAKSVSVHSFP
jgi:hypothetical protein